MTRALLVRRVPVAVCLFSQSDGAFCLVLEHCGKGTLDMLLHHFKSPLPRAPPQLPPRQLAAAAAAAAAAGCTGDAAGEQHQQQQQLLTRPDVPKLLRLMRGVARGLLHLHTRQPAILHRDIKPANILVGLGMQVGPVCEALPAWDECWGHCYGCWSLGLQDRLQVVYLCGCTASLSAGAPAGNPALWLHGALSHH